MAADAPCSCAILILSPLKMDCKIVVSKGLPEYQPISDQRNLALNRNAHFFQLFKVFGRAVIAINGFALSMDSKC